MFSRQAGWLFCTAALLASCGSSQRTPESAGKLTVAAAANLTDVFAEVAPLFKAQKGIDVVFSYAATAELSRQIENGAPFDVLAAADTEHVDFLVARQKLTAGSKAIYAKGQLALWTPGESTGIQDLKDLAAPKIRFIAIAQPKLAPYGQAAIEALMKANLWEALESKIVYANSISMAKQLAATGNADAAFTAYSLVLHERGTVLKIDASLYHPIEQSLAIVATSSRMQEAQQFRSFLLGSAGRAILAKNGYLLP